MDFLESLYRSRFLPPQDLLSVYSSTLSSGRPVKTRIMCLGLVSMARSSAVGRAGEDEPRAPKELCRVFWAHHLTVAHLNLIASSFIQRLSKPSCLRGDSDCGAPEYLQTLVYSSGASMKKIHTGCTISPHCCCAYPMPRVSEAWRLKLSALAKHASLSGV